MFQRFQLRTEVEAAKIVDIEHVPDQLTLTRLVGEHGDFIVDDEWMNQNKPRLSNGYGYLVRDHEGGLVWMNRTQFERDYEPCSIPYSMFGRKEMEDVGEKIVDQFKDEEQYKHQAKNIVRHPIADEDRDTIIEPPGSKERRRIIEEETDGRIDI